MLNKKKTWFSHFTILQCVLLWLNILQARYLGDIYVFLVTFNEFYQHLLLISLFSLLLCLPILGSFSWRTNFEGFFLNQLGMKFTLPCKWTNSYWCASCMSLELKKIFSFLRLVCIDISNGQEDICVPTANVIDIHLLHLQASSTI